MERPLFWHEGLFLQPQHFQLEDLHFQSLLTPFHRLLQPYFWGIGDLDIQEAALLDKLLGDLWSGHPSYFKIEGTANVEKKLADAIKLVEHELRLG